VRRASPPTGQALRRLADHFKLLTVPARARVMLLLADGERSVAEVADELGSIMAIASQHLAALRQAGLVWCQRDGRRRLYILTEDGREILRAVEAAAA
jgi:DNA-binding transcriptional ArsR family regulator